MFLPEYLMKGVDSSVHSKNVLREKTIIYNANLPQKRHQLAIVSFSFDGRC
jgi:hypothetical protein